ncbi:CLUMA_CG012472, isoform A [Clunio marinus]|uniref:CLUMA_CG012472, isoform A n=1 Tax=Clunio marinus TaxID=568069 RepID=A0A1J1IED2_9DIPT|nr:CLUMA_CG012472, isoform A [Clunio marinus]
MTIRGFAFCAFGFVQSAKKIERRELKSINRLPGYIRHYSPSGLHLSLCSNHNSFEDHAHERTNDGEEKTVEDVGEFAFSFHYFSDSFPDQKRVRKNS